MFSIKPKLKTYNIKNYDILLFSVDQEITGILVIMFVTMPIRLTVVMDGALVRLLKYHLSRDIINKMTTK